MTEFTLIADLVRRESGIVLPAAREAATLAAADRAAPGLGPAAFVRAAADPQAGPALVSRLIDEVTVQETAFVRDRYQLDAIDWPGLLRAARAAGSATVRVWSAACASGEEAYTLGLLAAEAFAPAAPPVDVLGTDISGAAIAAAAAARYGDRALRGLDPVLRERYLDRQDDGSYLVGRRLRRLTRLRRHNLARDPIPPPGEAGFDLIVCRNVLIYFDERVVRQVVESLRRSLRPGGTFVLGAADALQRDPAVPAPARPGGRRRPSRSDPPPHRDRRPARDRQLAAALDAAGQGERDRALVQVSSLLADNPFDADANFIDGLISLEAGRPADAVAALRRAIYADGSFGLAAFTLGRAYDALGDDGAARRSYELALRTLDPRDDRHGRLLQQIHIADIAGACRARLDGDPG